MVISIQRRPADEVRALEESMFVTSSLRIVLGIASIVGLVGISASALLIAVLAQKLSMTREEKYVHTFVLNIELAKKRMYLAANVLKFSMKVWFLKRKNKMGSLDFYAVQQKLFKSVYELQQIKKQQRNLTGRCLGLSELMNTQQKAEIGRAHV